jgi:predicted ATPase/DNA-binding SARP family transcriptional activator/predicted negative regulator of RcsB-dependent stress response
LTSFESNKVRALLAYLAVEADQPHPRDALTGLLWPHRSDRDALSNLRYALYNVRNVLGDRQADRPFFVITRQKLQFNRASDHSLDVATFQDQVAGLATDSRIEGVTELSTQPDRRRALQSAVSLYRGPFLHGFSLDDSPAFEEWVVFKREQINRQMIVALRLLAEYEEQSRNYEEARRCVRRHLELEPWDEGAHRHLMRLLVLDGRRNAALSQYEICRRLLADELGVEPTDRTTALYEQIRVGVLNRGAILTAAPQHSSSPSRPESSPPLPPSTPTPFVARERELEKLDRFLHLALADRGRVVFVTGDAGSGKTTLIDEFTQWAMASNEDLIVAGGRCCTQVGIGDPYLPFREILQMLTGDVEARRASGGITAEHARRLWAGFPEAVRALASEGPDLVDRLLPGEALALRVEAFAPADAPWRTELEALAELREARADRAAPTQSDLFGQVTRVLQTLARQHPLILVLDDLQWADSGSLSLLFHLMRHLTGHRILILGAYRPADLALGPQGERHLLEPIRNEAQRDFGDAEVDLNQADDRHFVEAFLDAEPNQLGRAFRETLIRHTDGNPLFTVELLRGLQERGDLVRDAAGRWVAGPTLDWGRLPARVEGVIAERVGRLAPERRETLTVASVEGESFTAEVLARVQGADEGQIIRRLSGPLSKQHRLVRAHSVRRVDGRRLSGYCFRHVLFQRYLYRSLDEVERARLHEAVGTGLETLYGERAAEISGQLAHHFEAAEMIPQAVGYLLQAGNEAVRLSANEEAVALFTRALDLLGTLPDTLERDRQEFALRLAMYAPLTATRGYACAELEHSNARAHALSLRLGKGRELIPALILLAGFYSFRAEFQTALELAERALALAERLESPGHIVWAAQVIGMTFLYQGDFVAARDYLERTLACDDAHHEAMVPVRGRDPQVVYRSFAAWVLWSLGYPDQAQELSHDALRLAQEANHPPSLAMALSVGNIVPHVLRREYSAIPSLVEAFNQLSEAQRLGLSEPGVRLARGSVLVHQGQAQAGIREMEQGLADWRATGTRAWASLHLGMFADAYLESGQLEQAQAALDEAFSAVRESGERMVEAELHRLQGEVRLAQGEADEAETRFRRAVAVARRQQARSWELRATTSLARLWGQQGRAEEGRSMLADIHGWFTEGLDTPDLQDARMLLDRLSGGRHSLTSP